MGKAQAGEEAQQAQRRLPSLKSEVFAQLCAFGSKGKLTRSIVNPQRSIPDSVKILARNTDNYIANWKVIALMNGDIEAVSGPAAQGRPGTHEWIVWQGAATNKAEALQNAEKADPRVDLEWIRIRYERDLDVR